MTTYRVHTLETAPEASRESLQTLRNNFGLIPNLAATMAESPTLINGFVGAFVNFSSGTFNNAERQILLLTNAVTNKNAWAVAFHSTAALKEGVASEDVRAIRDARRPSNEKTAALWATSRESIERRGRLRESDISSFADAGYSSAQLLEVLAGIAISTMANYAGNITNPVLETPFKAQEWTASESR